MGSKPIKAIRKVLAKSLFFQSALKMDVNRYNDDNAVKHKQSEHGNKRRIVFKVYGNNEYQGNVYIHPSLSSIVCADIEWIVYLDILYTSKPFMRGICAIKYEWIRKLLPKMNDNFAWMNAKEECKQDLGKSVVIEMTKEELQKLKETEIEKAKEKQNNIDSVRERYLKRKKLREMN